MITFPWATSQFNIAEFVIVGVTDESGSNAKRKGTSFAPLQIRKISNERDVFIRNNEKNIVQTQCCQINRHIHDAGNFTKATLKSEIKKIIEHKKIPITIGGDHSITSEVLWAINNRQSHSNKNKKFSLIYFDAHPDMICSEKKYYGSVICDVAWFDCINIKKSAILGIRAPEKEELSNLIKRKMNSFTSLDFTELGTKRIYSKLKKIIGKNPVYISIDMDAIDPSFAPGVSTPEPFGINPLDLLWLCKKLAANGLVGLDIMEVCPPHDIDNRTAHLASKLILETIESC